MSREDAQRPSHLLVIEDDPGERRLLLEALDAGSAPKKTTVVADGIEAMAFLRSERNQSGPERPDLIIMPMMLPRSDSRQLILEIKSDPRLKRIPILVLTSSQSEQDVDRAYESRANCYVVKPVDIDRFFSVVKAIEEFWLGVVAPPPV
jgi:two-component system, chemotaxis family, response regulator Rcp1